MRARTSVSQDALHRRERRVYLDRGIGTRRTWRSLLMVPLQRARILEHMPREDRNDALRKRDVARCTSCRTPATLAALAGSQPTPAASITAFASRISSSVTGRPRPVRLANRGHGAVLGRRVADLDRRRDRLRLHAVTLGEPVGEARAKGRRARRLHGSSRGSRAISPTRYASRSAFPNAAVLPRLPAGSAIQSGAFQSSCCSSSRTIVFCPSSRHGLIELRR